MNSAGTTCRTTVTMVAEKAIRRWVVPRWPAGSVVRSAPRARSTAPPASPRRKAASISDRACTEEPKISISVRNQDTSRINAAAPPRRATATANRPAGTSALDAAETGTGATARTSRQPRAMHATPTARSAAAANRRLPAMPTSGMSSAPPNTVPSTAPRVLTP